MSPTAAFSQSPARQGQLAGVQALRGIAALLVVFQHYLETANAHGFGFALLGHSRVGHIGVDVFFVISGFIIEYTAGGAGKKAGGLDFLARRAIRLLPIYWLVTLATFGLGALFARANGTHPGATELALSMLMLPATGADGKVAYIVTMAWSLTFEVFFYALFAATLHLGTLRRIRVLGALFVALVTAGLVLAPQTPLATVLVNPLHFEFLAGCVLAHLYRQGASIKLPIALLLTGVFMADMVTLIHFRPATYLRPLAYGLPAAALVFAVVLGPDARSHALIRPFTGLGDVSYSLYLSHFLSISAFVRIYDHVPALQGSSWLAGAALFALCISVAWACYRLVEVPSRRWLTRLWTNRTGALTAAATA